MRGELMRRNKFRKYAGITTLLLFLVAFIPSALSQSEGNGERETGWRTAGLGSFDSAAGGMTGIRIAVGTIAMGTAIAKAAVVAVAASPSNSASSTTSH